jgi:hypothetical protein
VHPRFILVAMGTLSILAARASSARCEDAKGQAPPAAATAQQARQAAERGLAFLEKDAVKWREEHKCASCHHGTMTVWALSEAKHQGYAVRAETLADMAAWAKTRALERIDQPRDSRPGWNLVNLPAMYLAVMAQNVPEQDVLARAERDRIADHVVRHQEADGSWAVPPPRNGPPPVFESPEVITLWASLALEPGVPANPKKASPGRDGRDKAAAWLSKAKPGESTQVLALRLLLDVRAGKSPDRVKARVEELLTRQHADGGWGQLKDLPSDAYATGQALYVLGLAGVGGDQQPVQRGVSFLVAGQRQDGSWPMTSRAQPGEKPFTNPVPITYFGSAWATLGLVRSVPK